jgi:hypothetical protein
MSRLWSTANSGAPITYLEPPYPQTFYAAHSAVIGRDLDASQIIALPSATSVTTVVTGLSGETDTALAQTRQHLRIAGTPPTEVDAGLHSLLRQKVTTGLAGEVDAGTPEGRVHLRVTSLPAESDAAASSTLIKRRTSALTGEADSGLASSRTRARTTTSSAEIDTAAVQGRTHVQVTGVPFELDVGLAASNGAQTVTTGIASEIDVALASTVMSVPVALPSSGGGWPMPQPAPRRTSVRTGRASETARPLVATRTASRPTGSPGTNDVALASRRVGVLVTATAAAVDEPLTATVLTFPSAAMRRRTTEDELLLVGAL